jgi:haloacid dehalogenase superfamily, subfamily IA, variant 3 with third motif having DD or ED/haloacid dehalogenase superfamily, subfamily IA, variant 1 with third motif having Dx(3-4)D or Dx(3-4)E
MKKAIIFDMDGVIVDSEPLHKEVERQMFTEFGMTISPERQHKFTGTSNANMWRQLKVEFKLPYEISYYVGIKEERYLEALAASNSVLLIPGAEELLKNLFSQGVKIAVASSSSLLNIDLVLRKFSIGKYFNALASGEEVALAKPNPAVFLLASQRLGVNPSNCVVIEDSTNGVRAAKAAGMTCVGLQSDSSLGQNLAAADLTVSSLSILNTNQLLSLA